MEESTLQIRKTMQIKIGMNPFYTPLSDCIRALKKERKKKKAAAEMTSVLVLLARQYHHEKMP